MPRLKKAALGPLTVAQPSGLLRPRSTSPHSGRTCPGSAPKYTHLSMVPPGLRRKDRALTGQLAPSVKLTRTGPPSLPLGQGCERATGSLGSGEGQEVGELVRSGTRVRGVHVHFASWVHVSCLLLARHLFVRGTVFVTRRVPAWQLWLLLNYSPPLEGLGWIPGASQSLNPLGTEGA